MKAGLNSAQRLAGSLAFELAAVRTRAQHLGLDHAMVTDLDHALLLATALAAGRPGNDRHAGPHRVLDAIRADLLLSKVNRARQRAIALAEPAGGGLAEDLLAPACVYASRLAAVHQTAVDAAAFRSQVRAGRISPWAARLVEAAAWLIPAADRDRYRSEFHSELCEIVRTAASRRQQLQYAARQLLRAAPLRAAVIAHQRRRTVR